MKNILNTYPYKMQKLRIKVLYHILPQCPIERTSDHKHPLHLHTIGQAHLNWARLEEMKQKLMSHICNSQPHLMAEVIHGLTKYVKSFMNSSLHINIDTIAFVELNLEVVCFYQVNEILIPIGNCNIHVFLLYRVPWLVLIWHLLQFRE